MRNIVIIILIIISQLSVSHADWKRVFYIDNNHSVEDIKTIDSNDCLILYTNMAMCKIINSTDCGKTWSIIHDEFVPITEPMPFPTFPWRMECPAKNWIYLGYQNMQTKQGVIKRTKDKCKTFDTLYINTGFTYTILKYFCMKDTLTGIVSTGDPYLFITKDGWDSNKQIKLDVGQEIYITGVYMHSYNEFSFVSSRADLGSYYYYTEDGGDNWNSIKLSDPTVNLSRIFFLDRNIGWISAGEKNNVGDQRIDVIFKTTDGGKKWQRVYHQENNPIVGLLDVNFRDEKNGIAVGMFGKCLRTSDGGENWVQEFSEDSSKDFGMPYSMHVAYIGSKPIIGATPSGIWMINENTDVSETINNDIFSISPNPANNFITISKHNNWINHTIDVSEDFLIYNSIGKLVLTISAQDSLSLRIDISDLTSGVYFVRYGSEYSKFIKE